MTSTDKKCPLKIRYMSDIHLELSDFTPAKMVSDVVVLAGDIHTGTEGLEWAARNFTDCPIIYLPGNHEYYGLDFPTHHVAMAEAAERLGIHFLDNQEVVIGHVRFVGGTLWTDFSLHDRPKLAMQEAGNHMNDYHQITNGQALFCPEDTLALHQATRTFLERRLLEPFDGKTVVVTHHAPSFRSLPKDRQDGPHAAAYASNLEPLAQQADVWIHGHTHQRHNYQLGQCQVLCNPRGYITEFFQDKTGFDDKAFIEI